MSERTCANCGWNDGSEYSSCYRDDCLSPIFRIPCHYRQGRNPGCNAPLGCVNWKPKEFSQVKLSEAYWKRARGQYLDCLGGYGKKGNNCGGCTRETQNDCIEYAEFVKKEAS